MFEVVEEDVELSDGRSFMRVNLEHPGAVVILPKDQGGNLILVNQYRHSVRSYILEFPAGTLEEGEEPESCARRELQEEVKQAAKDWVSLGTLFPAPGFCNEQQHLFFASDLTSAELEADHDEVIEIVSMSVQKVEEAIVQGRIVDAKTIAAFMRARLHGLV
jgi:ADP-ribose pyrophosphatase